MTTPDTSPENVERVAEELKRPIKDSLWDETTAPEAAALLRAQAAENVRLKEELISARLKHKEEAMQIVTLIHERDALKTNRACERVERVK